MNFIEFLPHIYHRRFVVRRKGGERTGETKTELYVDVSVSQVLGMAKAKESVGS